MSELDELLRPVEGSNPAGEDLRYSALYDQIKEARRQDDDLSQGAWQRERKVADYALTAKLIRQALAKSKDLQLAAWLAEAWIYQNGFGGLRAGVELCLGLVERFWDYVYPELEDGDAELRAAPLSWAGSKLDLAVRSVPLVKAGHDWFAYKESRALGYEDASATPEQKAAREKAVKAGKVAPEAFDKAFAETPKFYYAQAEKDLDGAGEALTALDRVCGERFGDNAPAFGKLRAAIEEVRHTAHTLLEKKRQAEPDPEEKAEQPEQVAEAPAAAVAAATATPRAVTVAEFDAFAEADRALKAGQAQEALQILNRDLATRSSGRGRFLTKLELARVCLAAGKEQIAQPLLDDLAATIDQHKLDEWEERETVAAALVTIWKSSKRVQGDANEKKKVFERICRLDPGQALGC